LSTKATLTKRKALHLLSAFTQRVKELLCFRRIKTNSSGGEFLYLPLEVEVSSQPGLYCPQELIDFGLLPTGAPPGRAALLLLNAGSRPTPVQSVVATPVTEAVTVAAFEPGQRVPADAAAEPTVVAEIVFDRELLLFSLSNQQRVKGKARKPSQGNAVFRE